MITITMVLLLTHSLTHKGVRSSGISVSNEIWLTTAIQLISFNVINNNVRKKFYCFLDMVK